MNALFREPLESGCLAVDSYAASIAERLAEPFDVRQVWSAWAPELAYGRHLTPPPPDARHAAVLVLLYPREGTWQLPLIERITDTTVHSGQISLPGGATDANETAEQCAVREMEEELGTPRDAFRLCGRLTPTYIFASNYLVTPCVAITDTRPMFRPNATEVASLIEIAVSELQNDARFGSHQVRRRGVELRAPHLEFQGHRIWGATSMMLAEFAARLG
jgi:8-oxo-dGTP pyrophosphatase MutT (NUDIX family)